MWEAQNKRKYMGLTSFFSSWFCYYIVFLLSSFVICSIIHLHSLEQATKHLSYKQAHLVLPCHFHCWENTKTLKKTNYLQSTISPCWQHLYWRGSCLCFQDSAPEPSTWRTVEWGSARSFHLKDRRVHKKKKKSVMAFSCQYKVIFDLHHSWITIQDEMERTEQRTSQNVSSFDLWKSSGRMTLSDTDPPQKKKKSSSVVDSKGHSTAQREMPSKGYVTQLITIEIDWKSGATPLIPDTLQ